MALLLRSPRLPMTSDPTSESVSVDALAKKADSPKNQYIHPWEELPTSLLVLPAEVPPSIFMTVETIHHLFVDCEYSKRILGAYLREEQAAIPDATWLKLDVKEDRPDTRDSIDDKIGLLRCVAKMSPDKSQNQRASHQEREYLRSLDAVLSRP
ncbi:Hypothetical predicted protein [Olea europaea subsp. europaea]|uniref:Uncharacterized protein n=1 Tax=Olea europaea subsp. europaea TaxID=158383 RepID=A0A8S0U790_OLEEU|nr:Hypothetical predicted protein [Olea europaea subsp. europaea]